MSSMNRSGTDAGNVTFPTYVFSVITAGTAILSLTDRTVTLREKRDNQKAWVVLLVFIRSVYGTMVWTSVLGWLSPALLAAVTRIFTVLPLSKPSMVV